MKILRNKPQKENKAGSDKAANWLASGITKAQGYWANGMDRLFNKLSAGRKKVILISTCVVMALYSTAVIAFSFNRTTVLLTKPTAAIQPLSIIKPANPGPTGIPAYISRIEAYKKYLDSLGQTLDGCRTRDSILQRRPGLLDSLRQIEMIYCNR
jgi:hypothetical protein